MRLILGFALLTGVGIAQDPVEPVTPLPPAMKNVIDLIKSGNLGKTGQKLHRYLQPVCSVPLVEVHPPDPEPNGVNVRIPEGNVDNMPALILPAQPCK
jgi:hypothetical protein